MCCFSRPVRRVSETRIFCRNEGAEQLVVYEMSLEADEELAMVLPIPVARDAGEDAVRFVDLSAVPTFFAQLEVMFAPPGPASGAPSRQGGPQTLKVQQVGAFEASFVPRADDFDRLDPRFAIPSHVWASVPEVADHGFVVFKLAAPGPKPGLFAGLLGGAREPKRYHPMGFTYPRRDPDQLVFPTLHLHDGTVHAEADFDHVLYAQCAAAPAGWDVGPPSLRARAYGAILAYLDDAPGYLVTMRGRAPNRDVAIAA